VNSFSSRIQASKAVPQSRLTSGHMANKIIPYGNREGIFFEGRWLAMADELKPKRNTALKTPARRKIRGGGKDVVRHIKGPLTNSYVALLGIKAGRTPELLEHIKRGLDYRSWESFIRNTELRKEDAVNLVQISSRTLSRRKVEGRLHPVESDRLVRAARIFSLASDLFDGNVGSARRWLTAAQPALGGSTPIEYASTEPGAREVEALIGRLEHGIPS